MSVYINSQAYIFKTHIYVNIYIYIRTKAVVFVHLLAHQLWWLVFTTFVTWL